MKRLYIIVVIVFATLETFAQVPVPLWADRFGSTGDDVIQATYTDAAGNSYVAGSFNGTVDFDPTSGTSNQTSAGLADAYIAKYDAAGNLVWVDRIGSTGADEVLGITGDGTSVYVTGYFTGTVDFDPAAATTQNRISLGSTDIFIAKYAAATGVFSFANIFGSTGDDYGSYLALDPSFNIYVTGSFELTVDFDPSAAVANRTVVGGNDMFLAKYSSTGTFSWANRIGSVDDDFGRVCYVNGTVVTLGGTYKNTFQASPTDPALTVTNLGGTDGFIGTYSTAAGAFTLATTIRSTGDDNVTAFAGDATTLYVAGKFSTSATLTGFNSTSITKISNGSTDGYIARFDAATMNLTWMNQIGNSGEEFMNWITGDGTNIYVAGGFTNSLDLDPGTGSNIVNSLGSYDAFYGKYLMSTGAHVTGFSAGGTGSDQATFVSLDAASAVYLSGVFESTVDFNPSASTTNLVSLGEWDSFLVKYSQSGSTEPTASPTALSFPNTTGFSFGVNFTAAVGSPSGYIAIYKTGTAPTGTPVDGTTYNVGDVIGTGNVLFLGPQTTWNITSVAPSTTYNVAIFSYNGTGATINYKITAPLTGAVTTLTQAAEPGASPTLLQGTSITNTSFTVSYTAAAGPPGGYIAIRGTGALPTSDPVDGAVYTAGTTIGSGSDRVAFVGSGTSFSESGLSSATTYFYKVYAYNGATTSINYRTTSPLTGSVTTTGSSEPTAGPTNFTSSNITTTSFSYAFTISTASNVTGYVGIRKSGTAPTFVPIDGTELVSGSTNADGSLVAFVDTNPSRTFSGGTGNTTYYYKIYAYNGSGTNINYYQAGVLTGTVTTLDPNADDIGPDITDNTPTTVAPNGKLKISVTVTDNLTGVSSVYVDYGPTTSTNSEYADLVNTLGNTWEYEIDASFNSEQGIEYLVTAIDGNGNLNNTDWQQVLVSHTGDGLIIPYSSPGSAATNYRIISVPLDLTKKSINDVFSDDLGEYKASKYRLFHYNGTKSAELQATSSIEIGVGYWFIATDNKTIDSGPGTTADNGVGKPRTITVSNGWNQLGNPFNFNVDWEFVQNHSDNADKTFGALRTYKGSYANSTTLEKLSGGFVMVQDAGDGKLRIPIVTDGRLRAPEIVNFSRTIDSDVWAVDFKLKSGNIENPFAGFGMHPKASEQNDRYDDFTLPRFMDYLELNYKKTLFGSAFTKDIVPTTGQYSWDFDVASNLDEETITLSWDNSFFGNNDRQLVLWDVEQQRAVDMKSETSYTFERSLSSRFTVFFGDEAYVKAETTPFKAVFHSVSPVPAAGDVTFAFSVPETNGKVNTSLFVYNLMGQKIATLVNEPLRGGYQQAMWNIEDGAKPASGLYISVLKFGDTTLQKRLIIK